MKTIQPTLLSLIIAAVAAVLFVPSVARADDWEDRWEDWREAREEAREDWREAQEDWREAREDWREEQEERWEDWQDELEDRAEHQPRYVPYWNEPTQQTALRIGRRRAVIVAPAYVAPRYYGVRRFGYYDYPFRRGGAVRVGPVFIRVR